MRIFSAQGIAREGAPRYQVQTEEERYWQRREFIAGINIIGVRYAGDLEEDESASVLHGETPLPLPQDTELRASVTSSGVVAFTVHGAERT